MSLLHDEILARLSRPMPTFWKKVQKRSFATSAAFAGLVISSSALSKFLPDIVPTFFSYAAALFGGLGAACMLAVDDPASLPTAQPAPPAEQTDTPQP